MCPSHSTPAFWFLDSGLYCDVVQPSRKHIAGKTATRETGLHLPFSLSSLVIRILSWGLPPESHTSLSQGRIRCHCIEHLRLCLPPFPSGAVLPVSRRFFFFLSYHRFLCVDLWTLNSTRNFETECEFMNGSAWFSSLYIRWEATVIDLYDFLVTFPWWHFHTDQK